MSQLQSINQLLEKLQAPTQSVANLSFCDSSRDGVAKWVQSLPLTQIQFVGGILYKALPEISWLQTSAANRINILEILRAPTTQIIEGLSKHFLNQPLILPEDAIKMATIAQALQKHLNNGYMVTIRDLCKESNPKKHLLALSLHRAMMGMGLLLFRYYQLYLPVPAKLWSDVNSLYQLAANFNLLDEVVPETLAHHQNCNTIKLAYTRILLLACCRANQLRQMEITAIYDALNTLTHLAKIHEDDGKNTEDNLLSVAPLSNEAPNYRSRIKELGHAFILVLNTKNIIKRLEELNHKTPDDTGENTTRVNELKLSPALTQHLIQAWDLLPLRNLDRQPTAGTLNVTVGISSIHYHLAGKTHFFDFLDSAHRPQMNRGIESLFQNRALQSQQKNGSNEWIDPLDELDTPPDSKEAQDASEPHPIYEVPLIDTSPGGYCLEWRDEIPNQVKAGELLGLLDPVRNYWSLGVVRWANLTQGATQLGIQILAPHATPVGVALVSKSGEISEFLRALEIPATSSLNQPATLITNTVSFREQSKVRMYHRATQVEANKGDDNIQLISRCFATGVFNQFTFQYLTPPAPKEPQPSEKPLLFDPEWDA